MAEAEKTEADRIRERDELVLNELMGKPQGRDWMARLLDYCQMGAEIYQNDGDVYGALKRDGLAQAGRYIEGQVLDHCPDRYMQMIRERRARLVQQRKQIEEAEQGRETAAAGRTTIDTLADQQLAEGVQREAAAAKAEESKPKE